MFNTFAAGNFLIANPSIIGDASFHRAVVLLSAIEKEQPMGFIINKPFDFNLEDILPEVATSMPIFYGGPVDTDQLFFIHASTRVFENSQSIANNLSLGGSLPVALEALSNGQLDETNCRFFLGYSGWSAGQLENELLHNQWWIEKAFPNDKLLSSKPECMWRNALEAKGGRYLLWANSPDNPAHN